MKMKKLVLTAAVAVFALGSFVGCASSSGGKSAASGALKAASESGAGGKVAFVGIDDSVASSKDMKKDVDDVRAAIEADKGFSLMSQSAVDGALKSSGLSATSLTGARLIAFIDAMSSSSGAPDYLLVGEYLTDGSMKVDLIDAKSFDTVGSKTVK